MWGGVVLWQQRHLLFGGDNGWVWVVLAAAAVAPALSGRGRAGSGGKASVPAQSASKQFAEEVLKAHNDYRKKHGVPPLKLCKKLNREAQQYSEALASTRILKHSPESSSGKCGENLAWASYDQSGSEVAERWYGEIKNYNFQSPGFSSGTGHFTAMVWKNTKRMGVGKAAASDGSTFVVARYEPAGNIVNPGHYEQNVLPPKK
uniref:Golgi-associated plant pathogenesis-related protein 1 isoform X2 n=1 Tax=Pogona vitticeps TaxID=103695 RepID=A0A6J0UW49_9SAUR